MNGTNQFPNQPASPSQHLPLWVWIVAGVVALVLVAAAFYYATYTPALDVGMPIVPGRADDIVAIEKEVNELKLDDLGSELADIDKELAQ